MLNVKKYEFWFVTGSQHLYGEEALREVEEHSRQITAGLNKDAPYTIVCKPVLTRPEAIRALCLEANASDDCAGLMTWMHTFLRRKCGLVACLS